MWAKMVLQVTVNARKENEMQAGKGMRESKTDFKLEK